MFDTWEAPLFYMRPTLLNHRVPATQTVRTGLTRAISTPSPRRANRGRRAFPEASEPGSRPICALAMSPIFRARAIESVWTCGTNSPLETQHCCCGCSARSCCDKSRARSLGCCSKSRRAPPGGPSRGAPPVNTGDGTIAQRAAKQQQPNFRIFEKLPTGRPPLPFGR